MIRLLPLIFLLASCGGGGTSVTCTVEINADSVMSASTHPEPAAATLQRMRPAWVIDDRAVTGLSLDDLMTGFKQTPHPSQIVVIELGGNDAYEGRAPSLFKAQLTSAVQHLQAHGKTPVLTGIVQVETWGLFDQATSDRIRVLDGITREVATELSVPHAGWGAVPAQTTDGIHPTKDRLAVLLDRLVLTIDKLCK